MAATIQNLWSLQLQDGSALPILTRDPKKLTGNLPGTGILPQRAYTDTSPGAASDIIDVVATFPWTINPPESRITVPYASLIEKRIIVNSNVSNLINSIFTSFDSVNSSTNLTTTVQNLLNKANQSDSNIAKAAAKEVQTALDTFSDVYNNSSFKQAYSLNNPILAPYDFLYGTEYTGFNYKIPYLGDDYNTATLDFGGQSENVLGGLAEIAQNIAGGMAGILGGLKPGTYIEKSKQFSMGETGRSIELKFPLLNTRKTTDITRNWQLIFGLIYQNRPGRYTRSVIDLPVIYQVQIPGVVYMPFAFISNLSVKFLGSRRLMNISVPIQTGSSDSTVLNTIIPDAYEVSITLNGMNEETRNFLYASVQSSPVTVNGKS